VDLESGVVLSAGPRFDMTPKGLAGLQLIAERLRHPTAEPPGLNSPPPVLLQLPDPWPIPSFAGVNAL
jgi:hypothetical protein